MAFPSFSYDGFSCRLCRGELRHDPSELISAAWYRYDELPQIPPSDTIARRLIEDTIANIRQDEENS